MCEFIQRLKAWLHRNSRPKSNKLLELYLKCPAAIDPYHLWSFCQRLTDSRCTQRTLIGVRFLRLNYPISCDRSQETFYKFLHDRQPVALTNKAMNLRLFSDSRHDDRARWVKIAQVIKIHIAWFLQSPQIAEQTTQSLILHSSESSLWCEALKAWDKESRSAVRLSISFARSSRSFMSSSNSDRFKQTRSVWYSIVDLSFISSL